jgi:IS30 family transposase
LAQEWSPEQIEGRMRQEDSDRRVSSQTIYTWIK